MFTPDMLWTMLISLIMLLVALWLQRGLLTLGCWGVSAYSLYYALAHSWGVIPLMVIAVVFLFGLFATIYHLMNKPLFF